MKEIIFKVITYCYTDDILPKSKVVGIFTQDKISEQFEIIKNTFGKDKKIKSFQIPDKESKNYYLEFDDNENSHFYSGDYILNELDL